MREELSKQVEALLGPKTEADMKPPEKKKKLKAEKPKPAVKEETVAAAAVPEEGVSSIVMGRWLACVAWVQSFNDSYFGG